MWAKGQWLFIAVNTTAKPKHNGFIIIDKLSYKGYYGEASYNNYNGSGYKELGYKGNIYRYRFSRGGSGGYSGSGGYKGNLGKKGNSII